MLKGSLGFSKKEKKALFKHVSIFSLLLSAELRKCISCWPFFFLKKYWKRNFVLLADPERFSSLLSVFACKTIKSVNIIWHQKEAYQSTCEVIIHRSR